MAGTLFNVEAADRLAADVQNSVVSSNGGALTGAATARDMALNARTASRALQSAPSEACISPLHPSLYIVMPQPQVFHHSVALSLCGLGCDSCCVDMTLFIEHADACRCASASCDA